MVGVAAGHAIAIDPPPADSYVLHHLSCIELSILLRMHAGGAAAQRDASVGGIRAMADSAAERLPKPVLSPRLLPAENI